MEIAFSINPMSSNRMVSEQKLKENKVIFFLNLSINSFWSVSKKLVYRATPQ